MTRSRTTLVVLGLAIAGLLAVAVVVMNGRPPPDAGQPAGAVFRVGLVTNSPNGMLNLRGFQDGLRALGYVEGETIAYLFAGKPTPQVDLQSAIEAMVEDRVDLIFTSGTPTGVAAKAATAESGTPVVFGVIADPIAAGIMTDLNRPGGNMTGVMLSQNQARRLELLSSVFPDVRRVWLPYNPDDPAPVSAADQLERAAPAMGLTLVHAHARDEDEVAAILAAIPGDIDAIFMLPDSTVNPQVDELIRSANARNLPVSGPSTAQVMAGATLSYGIVHRQVGEQASKIADRILRGADAATMPVQTADFYLTLNLAAAGRIGHDLSEEVLQLADVILREDDLGK